MSVIREKIAAINKRRTDLERCKDYAILRMERMEPLDVRRCVTAMARLRDLLRHADLSKAERAKVDAHMAQLRKVFPQ